MKISILLLWLASGFALPLAAQFTTILPPGSVRSVGSSHSTTSDGIQWWSSVSLRSPSGQWHYDDTHFGIDQPDGSVSVPVTLDETGIWEVWNGDGYGAPASSSTWSQLTEYLDVQAAAPANAVPEIVWTSAPGSVAVGETYTVSAQGRDADGNLVEVNVWRDGQPFALTGGGDGWQADAGGATSESAPGTRTYSANAVDAAGAASATITHTVSVTAPGRPPVAAISGSTTLLVNETGHWSFSVSDPDGDLAGWRFFASTNPNPLWSPLSGGFASGSHSGSFPSPGTYVWIIEARDAAGAGDSAGISVTVTAPAVSPLTAEIAANPDTATAPGATTVSWTSANATAVSVSGPGLASAAASGSRTVGGLSPGIHTYTLTAEGPGGPLVRTATVTVGMPATHAITTSVYPAGTGSVSGGGTYASGATATLTASAAPAFVFTGWSGGLSGSANPASFTVTEDRFVTANFAPASFVLTTTATSGGTVTPGGTYPAGAVVTVAATALPSYRFTGWTGDAGGSAEVVAVVLDRDRTVNAVFGGRLPQTISFPPPGEMTAGAPAFALGATASSGLPVSYILHAGSAVLDGGELRITGVGAITVEANQLGDALYLPAPPVARTFNATAGGLVRYRGTIRTLLRSAPAPAAPPFVLDTP